MQRTVTKSCDYTTASVDLKHPVARPSSVKSAKEEKAVVEAKLKSYAELNKLELQQAEERADFERQLTKQIKFQQKLAEIEREQEDFKRNRRLQAKKS